MIPQQLPSYPWETAGAPHLRPITKEHFRCRGRRSHPPKPNHNGELQGDCDGYFEHGLPVRNGEEGVQPILIELLNILQEKTKNQVIVTSGHRCPKHQAYLYSHPKAQASKHQVGAEVAFYIPNWEPENLIPIIENFYKSHSRYEQRPSYLHFKRWDKETDVRTPPWYNEEIFIKIYQQDEGRNEDNSHPFPYLSIQVRYDMEKGEKVQYTWKGSQEYFR